MCSLYCSNVDPAPPPQSDVHLIKKGEKVGASEATLLQMLKIFPFSYGLIVKQGQHYYHTHTVDHTVADTAVLIDVSYIWL